MAQSWPLPTTYMNALNTKDEQTAIDPRYFWRPIANMKSLRTQHPSPPNPVSLGPGSQSITRPSEEKSRLRKLPTELLNMVTDNLDIVSLFCLRNTNNYFRASITKTELSPCAKVQLIHHLNKDKLSFLKMYIPGAEEGRCSGYAGPKYGKYYYDNYCNNCRCNGHMEYCLECGVRTCLRKNLSLWKNWTNKGDNKKSQQYTKIPSPTQDNNRTDDGNNDKTQHDTKPPSPPQEKCKYEDEPVLRLRGGAGHATIIPQQMYSKIVNVKERLYLKHRVERRTRDSSRRNNKMEGIVYGVPVVVDESMDTDEEMSDGMDDEVEEEFDEDAMDESDG